MKKKNQQTVYGIITLLGMPQFKILDPNSVGYVEVNDKEITVYYKNDSKDTSIMSLIGFEVQCDPQQYCRFHSKYPINMNYAKSYRRNGRGLLVVIIPPPISP